MQGVSTKNDFLYSFYVSAQRKEDFSVVLCENSIKMTTINSFFLPRWGQLTQYLLSAECHALLYWPILWSDKWMSLNSSDVLLVLSQTHYWLDGWLLSLQAVTNLPKQAKGNLWMATYHLLSWLTPRYAIKIFPPPSTDRKRLSENKLQSA